MPVVIAGTTGAKKDFEVLLAAISAAQLAQLRARSDSDEWQADPHSPKTTGKEGDVETLEEQESVRGPHCGSERPSVCHAKRTRDSHVAAHARKCQPEIPMNNKAYASILALICATLGFWTGCGSSSSAPPPVVAITATSGTPQNAVVDTVFDLALQAKVTSGGLPASGVTVTFTAPASGASGTFASTSTATETDTTNGSGVATSSMFTANGTIGGPYTVTAATPLTLTTATFSLTNTSSGGVAQNITATGGTPQSAAFSTAFALPLQATVTLPDGSPASGVTVTFTAPASGASGTFASTSTATETDTTNGTGVATSSVFTANATVGGPYSVTATTPHAVVPASFTLTNKGLSITATSGTPQRALATTVFAPLQVTVTLPNGQPASGVFVTFTAPASGASGTFANGTATETDYTDDLGGAISSTFTANATVGGPYSVTATTPNATAPASFTLTNTAAAENSINYVFYMSGHSKFCFSCNYALAGSVAILPGGTVVGGEEYNNTIYSPVSPITGGMLSVDPGTGQGTLTLTLANNPYLYSGTETFAVQFVNSSHALISEYDGAYTSSGSMDLQTQTNPPSLRPGSYAFTLSGADSNYNSVAYGGVFTIPSSGTTLQNGVYDSNDAMSGVTRGTTLSGTFTEPDAFGFGTIASSILDPSSGQQVTLYYFVVGPEVIRMVVNGSDDAGVSGGSAFGQGTNATAASNASLGNSVFALADNPLLGGVVGAVGQFSTSNTSSSPADLSGVADDNVVVGSNSGISARAPITGTYSIASNGYGGLTIQASDLDGHLSVMGIYLTDPNLNLNDPNNASGFPGGGALVLDLDANGLAGVTGVIVPQTDTNASAFSGNYAVGAQDFNTFNGSAGCPCEFDLVGQASVANLAINGNGLISDPEFTLSANATDIAAFSGIPVADTNYPGRYALYPFVLTPYGVAPRDLDMVFYQASGGQLFWLENDSIGAWLGPLEQQGSLTGIPAGNFATITATGGTPQSAAPGTSFASLQATVTLVDGLPASGVPVTFTAPASGPSGTFMKSGTATEMDTTNGIGVATSSTFTANATTGGPYSVTASTPQALLPATFALTNTAAVVAATGGTPQSAMLGAPFASPLQATVTLVDGLPASGVPVTFTAPASGPSGTFMKSGTATEMDTTNGSGVATSSTFTANATVGGPYSVIATTPEAVVPASFTLTNTVVVAATNYVFYVSGQNVLHGATYYYALAGSVAIAADGAVVGGEQDYNDVSAASSPQPSGDKITGGALTISPATGQGTLTLITNNVEVGVNGTETFGIQFVNGDHALITEYDASATSSGSMDLQTLTSPPSLVSGSYAFILAGQDGDYFGIAYGGVFTIPNSGKTLQNGLYDVNDIFSGVAKGATLSGTFTEPDSFGRGTITSSLTDPDTGISVALNYYVVGPEAIRIIDVGGPVGDIYSAVGSAFGQGTNATAASNASLGNSVFALASNSALTGVAALGQFSTSNTSSSLADLSGVADDNVLVGIQPGSSSRAQITGTYSIASNGYGSLTITTGALAGYLSAMGIYLTDPNLNLNDPNNASGFPGGGALVLDLDASLGLAGVTGVIVPQTDTNASAFSGNYAVGAQDFNFFNPDPSCPVSGDNNILCEFDLVGQGSVANLAINGNGLISDPHFTLTTNATVSVPFSGTPVADTNYPGRYALYPFALTFGAAPRDLDMSIYQASGGQLFWLEIDYNGVLLGPLEQQGSLTGLPTAEPAAKTQPQYKK